MDKSAKIRKYWEIVNKSNQPKKKKFIITDNITMEITENGYE